jgi:hypothetical protein
LNYDRRDDRDSRRYTDMRSDRRHHRR